MDTLTSVVIEYGWHIIIIIALALGWFVIQLRLSKRKVSISQDEIKSLVTNDKEEENDKKTNQSNEESHGTITEPKQKRVTVEDSWDVRGGFWKGITRMVITLLCLLASPVILGFLGTYHYGIGFGGIGFLLGILILVRILSKVTVVVGTLQALVTLDAFKGEMVIYGPGLHPSLPWETVDRKSNHSLEKRVISGIETIPSKTAEMSVEYQIEYAVDLNRLDKFAALTGEDVFKILSAPVRSFLTQEIAKLTGEETRKNQKELSRKAKALYDIPETGDLEKESLEEYLKDQCVHTLEEKNGIIVTGMEIPDVDFSKTVQESRGRKAVTENTMEAAAVFLGLEGNEGIKAALKDGSIAREQVEAALNRVETAKNPKGADRRIIEISGGNIGTAAMANLASEGGKQ